MKNEDTKRCLDNFMMWLDSPVGRMKYKNDTFLQDCVQYAKDYGYEQVRSMEPHLEALMDNAVVDTFCETVEAMPPDTKMELCDDTLKAIAQLLRKR